MSRDILVCMARQREWRRQLYSALEPDTHNWVASQSIELAEGETLDGLWVGVHARTTMIANDPTGVDGLLPINRLTSRFRAGLLWVDNPLTQLDPMSSLADVLWFSPGVWDFRPLLVAYPAGGEPTVQQTEWVWAASWVQHPVKVEGKRLVQPGTTRWITFNGYEDGVSFGEFNQRGIFQAGVSALVLLPEEE